MVFGPGMIVWSVWVGIILLRGSRVTAAQQERAPHRTPGLSPTPGSTT